MTCTASICDTHTHVCIFIFNFLYIYIYCIYIYTHIVVHIYLCIYVHNTHIYIYYRYNTYPGAIFKQNTSESVGFRVAWSKSPVWWPKCHSAMPWQRHPTRQDFLCWYNPLNKRLGLGTWKFPFGKGETSTEKLPIFGVPAVVFWGCIDFGESFPFGLENSERSSCWKAFRCVLEIFLKVSKSLASSFYSTLRYGKVRKISLL